MPASSYSVKADMARVNAADGCRQASSLAVRVLVGVRA